MSDWKVDPDTRRRLLQLQKERGNKRCVDCDAPNPQWASPKFGVFICLECAGTHRSLGVHISFVRSITMDQFKPDELVRMEKGGNDAFKEYMSKHGIDLTLPHKLKYDNPIAEDYKEKLTCEVEGKQFNEPEHKDFDPTSIGRSGQDTTKPVQESHSITDSRQSTPTSVAPSQTERNEEYFAELGKRNQSKPEHLPPSQGGKYQGFGSTPSNATSNVEESNGPSLTIDGFQADPLGTLSKGWGMFSAAVTKSFEEVNENVIKPKVQNWNNGELSEDTKRAAAQFGHKFQETSSYGYQMFSSFTKSLQEQYFAEGGANGNGSYARLDADHDVVDVVSEDKDKDKLKGSSEGLLSKKKSDEEFEDF